MSVSLKSSGDIESILATASATDGTAELIFKAWDDVTPPFTVKVRSPDGTILVERVLRELPTGKPQSAPAVSFPCATPGAYSIHIRELYGKIEGEAVLTVAQAS